jgi:GntR family transcriptional regulator
MATSSRGKQREPTRKARPQGTVNEQPYLDWSGDGVRRTERVTADASGASAHQTPLHEQITRHIAQQIERGELPPGALLLPEVELARRFGVSRQTVRAGLDALVHRGLIERRRGRGTVVLRPKIEQSLSHFYSVAQTMRERGATLETRVLARGRLVAGDDLAAQALGHLRLEDPAEIGYLLRLRLVEGAPLLLEMITFPAALCPILLGSMPHPTGGENPGVACDGSETADPGAEPFYEALAAYANVRVSHARETFRPVAVTGYEARLLQVAPGTPVFAVERVSFAGNDGDGTERPVEWRHTLTPGDRYGYVVELVNPAEHDGE